jgi:hypothetical protein
VKYKWEKENEEVNCLDPLRSCEHQVCDCDRMLATCLRDALHHGASCPGLWELEAVMEKVEKKSSKL